MADEKDELKPYKRLKPYRTPEGKAVKPPVDVSERSPAERQAHALEYIANALYHIYNQNKKEVTPQIPEANTAEVSD